MHDSITSICLEKQFNIKINGTLMELKKTSKITMHLWYKRHKIMNMVGKKATHSTMPICHILNPRL